MTVRLAHLLFAVAVAVAIATALAVPGGAAAAPPSAPLNFRVVDGALSWHAENDFRLGWDDPAEPIGAIGYRVRDETSAVVAETRIPRYVKRIDRPLLPAKPGRYVVELWFESGLGEVGAAASTLLWLDNAAPGPVEPVLPEGWLGTAPAPLLRLSHPSPPLPLSGIRGYAVSLDQAPATSPCLTLDRCSDAEIDLRGGVGGDSMRLERLPEGTTYVNVVAVSGSGMRSATIGSAPVRVDATAPAVALRGVPTGWVDGTVTVTAVASDGLSGMAPGGDAGPITALSVGDAVPTVVRGGSASAVLSGEGVHEVASFARDAAGNVGAGPPRVVRIDRGPPRVAFASSLDAADPELIEARVEDSLSGADPSRGSISIRLARSQRQFTPLPTAISNGRLLARWDSDSHPPGVYEFRATGYDSAGNMASGRHRLNGSAMVLPAPLKAPTRLLAGFGGKRLVWHRCKRRELARHCRREVVEAFERRPASRVVPFGQSVTVGGILASATGAPLAALPVQVLEVFDGGDGGERRARTVETGADGSFLARLGPGPSRRVEFAFAGTRTLAGATARVARLGIRAGVRMRASSTVATIGGRPVVFSGRIGGGAIPTDGKAVELQFRLPGLPWTQFRTVQTDAQGRFRHPYRFSDDDSRGIRFQLRAFAPAEEGWPYEPAASAPVAVWGR